MADVVLQGISRSYGRNTVVNNIDLTIGDGEFVVLLGPSGCGKTTTLRMIAGLSEPTRGHIRIGGVDVTALPARNRNVGMVFQDYALFPHMNVAENIGFGLRERRRDKAMIARRVDELLKLTRLPDFGHRYPGQLSGGQQQRVALARALACSPSVLLMDEPLGALDLKLREAMQAELRRVQRELAITTVLVTHDQTEAMSLADRIVVMDHGQVQQIGTPDDLYCRPATIFVARFIGKINVFAGVLQSVSGATITVRLTDGTSVKASSQTSHPIGTPVKLVVRPEKLEFVRDGTHCVESAMHGVVVQRRFLGNIVLCAVQTKDNRTVLLERAGNLPDLEIGASGMLVWNPKDVSVFPGRESDEID